MTSKGKLLIWRLERERLTSRALEALRIIEHP